MTVFPAGVCVFTQHTYHPYYRAISHKCVPALFKQFAVLRIKVFPTWCMKLFKCAFEITLCFCMKKNKRNCCKTHNDWNVAVVQRDGVSVSSGESLSTRPTQVWLINSAQTFATDGRCSHPLAVDAGTSLATLRVNLTRRVAIFGLISSIYASRLQQGQTPLTTHQAATSYWVHRTLP